MHSVYIETTIPSYYHSTRKSVQDVAWSATTRRWWDHHRQWYRLVTSQSVETELRRAPPDRVERRLQLLDGIERLPLVPEIDAIVEEYIRHRLMPAAATGDASHVATASYYRIDYLLTWNCSHIANANKARHLNVINRRLGIHTPEMVTPYYLLPENAS